MKNQTTRAAVRSASSAGNGAAVNYRCRRARACGRPPTGFAKPFLTGWRRPLLTRTASIALPAAARWGWKRCPAMRPAPRCWRWSRGVAQQLQKSRHPESGSRQGDHHQHPQLPEPAGDPAPDRVRRPAVPSGLLEETLRLLETQGWLADEALVYVESEVENGLPPVPANWQLYREKVAGQVAYRLYQREAQGEHHAD